MELLAHVASKIRDLRTDAKLTQEGLAKSLGVAGNTVSRWETGAYKPDLQDLEKLARYFKISILAFFPGEHGQRPEIQALLSAANRLDDNDLLELRKYAEFRRARHMLDTDDMNR